MTFLEIGAVWSLVALVLIALRAHIGVALGISSFAGLSMILGLKGALGIITAVPFNFVGDWNLSAVPMFLLMGFVAARSGLTTSLFESMKVVFGRVPGSLAVASVGACALFAAASGSSVATAAAMARIATPEMLRNRYDPGLSGGVVAASGTLGSLIPPSILMILYGYFAEVSIGQLFIAGILPAAISALLYVGMIVVRVRLNGALAPSLAKSCSNTTKAEAIGNAWPLPCLVAGVLGGIFFGVTTPTEAGAVGAFLACVLGFVKGTLTGGGFVTAIRQTTSSTASVFLIVIGTVLFMRLMALSGVPLFISEHLIAVASSSFVTILLIAAIYVILGMFVDSIGLMLLTLPIVLPVVIAADMDLIWFGIIVIKLLEIGLVTPPIGLNVFVIRSALGGAISVTALFRGIVWFVVMDLVALLLIVWFPELSLMLPALMLGE